MRAAILARVSDEKQAADDRNSLPAQLRAMRRRCADEGWEIVREFVAPGESASTYELDRRPVLRELVESARRREFDLVVFHESSRLARDEEMAQWLINRLEQWGRAAGERGVADRLLVAGRADVLRGGAQPERVLAAEDGRAHL